LQAARALPGERRGAPPLAYLLLPPRPAV